jgi:hypothetical protein
MANSRMRRGARRSRESGEGHLRTVKDPLITATARGEADLLVTEDRTSATGLGKMGLGVSLWAFDEFKAYVESA